MKKKVLALVILLGCNTVYAASNLPSSNSDLRALEENRAADKERTALQQTADKHSVQGKQEILLEKFKFVGLEHLDPASVEALVQEYYGRRVTMDELQQAADTITTYLRQQGYAVGTAFLPPQDIRNHVIEIRIVLGHLDKVELNNNSRMSTTQLERYTNSLDRGNLLKTDELEHILNNINDLYGVTTVGVLQAGEAVGSSKLVIDVQDDKQFETIVYADNHGNKYSGRYRYGFQTTMNNPGKVGDKLFLAGMLSNGDLHNYNVGYEVPVGSRGTKIGVSYSLMDYTLGDYYNILGAVGKAKTFSIYGSTPLINTSSRYLAAVYGYDNRQLEDELRTFKINTQKHSNALHVGLSGNYRNPVSYTAYSAVYYLGSLNYDDISNPYVEGQYHKLNTDINHIRRLGNVTNLHVNYHGQLASRDLDGSEQFSLGGATGVRAYPQGEANGDNGYQTTVELRYATPLPYLSLATYIDWGEVTLSKRFSEHRNLAGWGLGVQYSKPNDYYMRLDYARKINGETYQSEDKDKNGRWWFLTYKLF